MEHYVCTGECGGVSEQAKTCGAEGCSQHGQPLTACACEDGQHSAAKESSTNKA